jgi:hypothetical protein
MVRSCRDSWCFGTILALLVIGPAGGAPGELGDDSASWRRPEFDGVNCLYLQLRLLGYTGTYKEVVAAMPEGAEKASLGGLAQAAARLGFTLAPIKLTVAELARLRSPVVILFEEAGLGHGRFHLLLGFSPTKAVLMDGKFVIYIEMPKDRFRRAWTGLILVPRSTSPWSGRWLKAALGAVGAVVVVWLARYTARRRQRQAPILPGGGTSFSPEAV